MLKVLTYPLIALVLLGAIGFIAGYLGPLQLNPDATVRPLLGIFFTGPLWAGIALLGGLLAAIFRVSPKRFLIGLGLAAFVAISSTLFMSLPEDRWQGSIVEGRIVGCEPPANLVPGATIRWSEVPPQDSWWKPRGGWREDIPRMLQSDRGVVLNVYVTRERQIYANRKPWNNGSLSATRWRQARRTEKFYSRESGEDCRAYSLASSALYAPEWEASDVSPPNILPTFLGLSVLKRVPSGFQRFTRE
jgi:hypothetical protein